MAHIVAVLHLKKKFKVSYSQARQNSFPKIFYCSIYTSPKTQLLLPSKGVSWQTPISEE